MSATSPPEVSEAFVLAKCNFYVDTQVWPLKSKLNPEGWLKNFPLKDRKLAVHLLNGFMYYSDHMTNQLFMSNFRGLSRRAIKSHLDPHARRDEWRRFCERVVFTYPTGESPSIADSGFEFGRKARDLLDMPEERLKRPDSAVQELREGSINTLVFVDDFVGTGSQFVATWTRSIPEANGHSFKTALGRNTEVYYIPLFATQLAVDRLSSLHPQVILHPAHKLTSEYSALNDPSVFWPASLKEAGRKLIATVSHDLGLPDTAGQQPTDWQGFAKLGLGIAFKDRIPDATLPIFYTTSKGWTPLWRRNQ